MNQPSEQGNRAGRLAGRIALVTGGGSGIGRAAALAYAREGATVLVAGRRAAEIGETVAMITAGGGVASCCSADISRDGDLVQLMAILHERYGRLDIAFNNAGIEGVFGPITDLTEHDVDRVVSINLKGTWLAIKHQVAAMRAAGNGGAIVNTSSWLARRPMAGTSAYAASKGGLDALMQAVALEVGPDQIRINNIYPGVIDTPMYRRLGDDAALARFAAITPLRRAGQPADVGDVAVWLSGDEARFVTGQSLMVDGGFTLASA